MEVNTLTFAGGPNGPLFVVKSLILASQAKTGKRSDDKIKKCLARTVRFEDDPVVRCTAAKTILDMNIFNNEEVVSVIKVK